MRPWNNLPLPVLNREVSGPKCQWCQGWETLSKSNWWKTALSKEPIRLQYTKCIQITTTLTWTTSAVLSSIPHPLFGYLTTFYQQFSQTGTPLVRSWRNWTSCLSTRKVCLNNWLLDHPDCELAWWGFRAGIHTGNFSLSISCIMWFGGLFISIHVCHVRFSSFPQGTRARTLWFSSVRSGAKREGGSKSRPGLFYLADDRPAPTPQNLRSQMLSISNVSIKDAKQQSSQAKSMLFIEGIGKQQTHAAL